MPRDLVEEGPDRDTMHPKNKKLHLQSKTRQVNITPNSAFIPLIMEIENSVPLSKHLTFSLAKNIEVYTYKLFIHHYSFSTLEMYFLF